MDGQTFVIDRLPLQCGEILPQAKLVYETHGRLNGSRDNAVVLPTFYTGTHIRNRGFFGPGRAIDPARHYIVSVNMFGNGCSSSPSNTPPPFDGPRFPRVTLFDNVYAQNRLLESELGVDAAALVTGWSMAGCQSYQWGAQYPDKVKAILPFCCSAKTSIHNRVFLEGVKAALQADRNFNDGDYAAAPEAGLKAFGRVYAGWAYSQSFYRQRLYRQLGFETVEDLLRSWEADHLQWDANDLLCKLQTWQLGDISDNELYRGDFMLALSSIKARTINIACSHDLYFRPADNAIEVAHIAGAELRVHDSPWGHCAASPGNDPEFHRFLDQAVRELLE